MIGATIIYYNNVLITAVKWYKVLAPIFVYFDKMILFKVSN
jgi:hypothetical protein